VRIQGQLEPPWRESVAQVNEAVQAAVTHVRHCYDRALHDHPGLRGKVVIRVEEALATDSEEGTVDRAVVKRASDILDTAFLCCVEEAQSEVFLPVAHGTATAVYAITLRPGIP